MKAEADAYGVSVRAGVITPQLDDEHQFRQKLSLPAMGSEAKAAWTKDEGVRRPITITPQPGAPSTKPAPKDENADAEEPET